jgi:Ser/Thr protein kinase RdoA (MazF antagonist)
MPASFVVHRIGDVVVKLVLPRCRPQLEAEIAALPIARRALGDLVPERVGVGEIEGWGYVITTVLPGVPLGSLWATLDAAGRARAMRRLGELLAGLHRADASAFTGAHADWQGYVDHETRACVDRQSRWGFPAHLVAQIEPHLSNVDARGAAAPALLHADATPDNLLVSPVDDAVTGLVDWGDARLGDPAYDLITPSLFQCRGDARLCAALFEGYGKPLDDAMRHRLMTYSLIHRYNDMTRFLDVAPDAATLEELAARLWPS